MTYKIVIIILLVIFNFSHFAVAAETAQYPILIVSEPWSFKAIYAEVAKRYGYQGISEKQISRNEGLLEVLYLPPFNILSLAYFKIIGRDSDSISAQVTKVCGVQKKIESKISCISHQISPYVQALPKYKNGITFDYRTFCAIAANLFFKSFNSLNIKGARAGFVESSWMLPRAMHVVSSVFITSSNGLVYSYVIDVGNLPEILFPLSEPAIRWHNNQNSNHDQMAFPNIELL